MNKHELPEGWTLTTPDDYVPTPLINRDGWIEALESGRYSQGKRNLCYDGKYCCLGVLCDITPGVTKKVESNFVSFDTFTITLPCRHEWSGVFIDGTGSLPRGCRFIDPDRIQVFSLASANDSGASFATIAAAIRILYANQD